MKADAVLVEHHELLRDLLRRMEATPADEVDRREQLRELFADEISIHAQIEDEVFYPVARDVSPLVPIAHAEHRQIDDQLAAVLRVDPSSDEFLVEVRMLASAVEHHASKEEREMFPQSHALGEAELERLGDRLRTRQAELRRSRLTRLRLRVKRETLKRLP
jgi:hemerythrin-like domain-containing protein